MNAAEKRKLHMEVAAAVRNQLVACQAGCELKEALARALAPYCVVNARTFPGCVADAVLRGLKQMTEAKEPHADI